MKKFVYCGMNITKDISLRRGFSKRQSAAIEIWALEPAIGIDELAGRIGVGRDTIVRWRKRVDFIDAVYDRYMQLLGLDLPAVLFSMVREAKSGNVQAARLILEHSGKLVKRLNITVESPFEKFLRMEGEDVDFEDVTVDSAKELVADIPVVDDLPERVGGSQSERSRRESVENKEVGAKAVKKAHWNEAQRLRRRAERVGYAVMPIGSQKKSDRMKWIVGLEKAERDAGVFKYSVNKSVED